MTELRDAYPALAAQPAFQRFRYGCRSLRPGTTTIMAATMPARISLSRLVGGAVPRLLAGAGERRRRAGDGLYEAWTFGRRDARYR